MSKKKVLIPLDGSPFSRAILPTLIKMFNAEHYTVTLLRVSPLPLEFKDTVLTDVLMGRRVLLDWSQLVAPELEDEPDDRQAERLARLQHELEPGLIEEMRLARRKLEHAGFAVTVEIRFGAAAEQIHAYADEHAFDLIAMATHGRSGLAKLVMGSVAARLLEDCRLPLLLLRPHGESAAETLPQAARTGLAFGT